MPNTKINYSHTTFYKISCKDPSIVDIYVGHTTNFVHRKYIHKKIYTNGTKSSNPIYNIIRQNGGWDNWEIIVLEERECVDAKDAKNREKYHYAKIQQDMCEKTDHVCDLCGTVYKDRTGLWRHRKRCIGKDEDPHIYMEHVMQQQRQQQHQQRHHILENTVRVNNNTFEHNENPQENNQLCITEGLAEGEEISGDYMHKIQISNDVIMKLIEKNQELQHLLLEQNAKIIELSISHQVINNNNITNHTGNNHLNINMFLNEKCKDAVNLMDFVNDLEIEVADVEYVGKHGFVEGISKIFTNGLNQFDMYRRPIHCTDLKRETLYIKDDDKWEKETDDKSRILKAISRVAKRNVQQISKWYNEHPECNVYNSSAYDLHIDIMKQSMGGATESEVDRNTSKIVRNIAKTVLISKQTDMK